MDKSNKLLGEAGILLGMKLYDAAGRDAYHCRLRDRPNSEISPERAAEAVTIARRFVSKMIELIETGTQGEQSFA